MRGPLPASSVSPSAAPSGTSTFCALTVSSLRSAASPARSASAFMRMVFAESSETCPPSSIRTFIRSS